jgi:hypothetical protein
MSRPSRRASRPRSGAAPPRGRRVVLSVGPAREQARAHARVIAALGSSTMPGSKWCAGMGRNTGRCRTANGGSSRGTMPAYERALFRFARAVAFDLARSIRGAAAHTAVLPSALAFLRIVHRLRRGRVPDPRDERIVFQDPGPRPSPAELSILARVLTLRGLGEKDRLRRPRLGLDTGVERLWPRKVQPDLGDPQRAARRHRHRCGPSQAPRSSPTHPDDHDPSRLRQASRPARRIALPPVPVPPEGWPAQDGCRG